MWLQLPTAIRARLLTDATVAAAIGERLHYQELPQDSAFPHVWFRRQGNVSDQFLDWDEIGLVTDRYVMEICADQDASELVDAIINSLRAWKNVQIDDRYLQFVEVEDADDDYVFLTGGASEADYLHALQIVCYHAE